MPDISANNKRIAKNTLFLYIRMLFIMAVQLYTSRVVLNALGVVDYGLYNVVGGVVTMFAFLNGAMITSTQRYITFEIGRGDTERLKTVFSTCLQIHLLLSAFIVILAETGTLPKKYSPHALHGKYTGCMECHLLPDWLLVWKSRILSRSLRKQLK